MGKASKWIKNFLMGKKEDKERMVPPMTYTGNSNAIVPSTPRVRRKWSFGRSKGKDIFQHKFSKSLDAMDASVLPVQLMLEYAKNRNISPWVAITEPCYDFRDKAATKIQAVFRSFLARKALCALRGLVKIQALVRGHQVRKQTTTTLRCMHALMTIQVRARVHRIQNAEGKQVVATRQSLMHRRFHEDEVPNEEMWTGKRDCEKRHHKATFHSSRLRYEGGGEEKSLAMHSSLRYCPSKTISSPEEVIGQTIFYRPEYVNKMADEKPGFMANTKSSKAKKRAQSEPKQRPNLGTREKGRLSTSIEGASVYVFSAKRSDDHAGLVKDFNSRITLPVNSDEHRSTKSGGYSTYPRPVHDYDSCGKW